MNTGLPLVTSNPLIPDFGFQGVQRRAQAGDSLLVEFIDGFALPIEVQFGDAALQALHRE